MHRAASQTGGPSARLPLYDHNRHRSDSPDSPSYRAKGARRNAVRLATWRVVNWFRRTRLFSQCIIATLLILALLIWFTWQIQVEIVFYPRSWIRNHVEKIEPLHGCFKPENIPPTYNLTLARAPKRHEVHSGISLQLGMSCYDFAGTIRNDPASPSMTTSSKTYFHTYWRTDLVEFDDRQAWMLRSFFATQDLNKVSLILWSDHEKLKHNPYITTFLRTYPKSFSVRVVEMDVLARHTALAGSRLLKRKDKKAWVDGDLVRLLVTWEYGGVWIDMDSLLTRDLSPLLEHEFVTQWDCYGELPLYPLLLILIQSWGLDKIYQPLNGALMHFLRHSPYLCEAFHIMARSPDPRPGTTDWGSTLYLKLWRRLMNEGIPPFKILPFCFSDGRSCRLDNRIPDPFVPDASTWGGGRKFKELEGVLDKIFSVHLHNQWEKNFPSGGWVERFLLKMYERKLSGAPMKEAGSGRSGHG